MAVRPARSDDLPLILDAGLPKYEQHPTTTVSGQDFLAWTQEGYRQHWADFCVRSDLAIWVDEASRDFLVARLDERESLTGEIQCAIQDWGAHPEVFLPALRERALQLGATYLVARHYQGGPNPWEALGFRPELRRVVAEARGRQHTGAYRIRPIESRDLFFAANLHTQGSQFYLPSGRGIDPQEMVSQTMTLYLSMDFGPQSEMRGWVISDGRKPFGYILFKVGLAMEVTGAPAAYLYDIHLKPEYWGRMAARMLLRHSFWELGEQGQAYVVGDISEDNLETFGLATRAVNFRWESTRWGLALRGKAGLGAETPPPC